MVIKKYFAYSPWDGFELFETEQEAKDHAEGILGVESDNSSDGWHPEVENICWGKLSQHTIQTMIINKDDVCTCDGTDESYDDCEWPDHDWDFTCDYELEDI